MQPHPWLKPLSRRVGTTAVCVAWLAFESWQEPGSLWFWLAAGTTDGLTHYLLSAPSGVAINLPGGSIEADHKVHWTETGHAKKVWVRSVDEGDQVRVFFPDDGPRSYQVATDGSDVTLTISQ